MFKKLFKKDEAKEANIVTVSEDAPQPESTPTTTQDEAQEGPAGFMDETEPDFETSIVINNDEEEFDLVIDVSGSEELTADGYTHEEHLILFEDPSVIGYRSREEQAAVFSAVIPYAANFTGESILDVGCGLGDMYAYIEEVLSFEQPNYTGIDKDSDMLSLAHRKFFDVTEKFILGDFKEWEFDYDWIVAASAFNIKTQDDMTSYVKEMIEKMYNQANLGVGINLMSKMPPIELQGDWEGEFVTYDPAEIFQWALNKFKRVTLMHDYIDGDFVLHIYK